MVSENFMKNHWSHGGKKEKIINKIRKKSRELMTLERIENLRKINKGRSPWNKGKKTGQIPWNKGLTKETNNKIKEVSERLKVSNKGKHFCSETEFKKGLAPWNKNKELPKKWEITKEFLIEQHINNKKSIREIAKEMNIPHRTLTNYFHKLKVEIKEYPKGFCIKHTPWNKGISSSLSSEKAREMRLNQKFNNPSKPELNMRQALDNEGISYETDKNILGRTQPDMFIAPSLCVYIDGNYFHANPIDYPNSSKYTKEQKYNVKRDKWINKNLPKKGYVVLRFWESDIKKNLPLCISKIKEL
jgi:DNA mismatch endonuclease (patch repair protein)